MAESKWKPSAALNKALEKLAKQQGGKLNRYSTAEHIAVLHYYIGLHCEEEEKEGKDAEGKAVQVVWYSVPRKELKEALSQEASFLAYASNAKKLLIGAGLLPAEAKAVSEYED